MRCVLPGRIETFSPIYEIKPKDLISRTSNHGKDVGILLFFGNFFLS